MLQITCNILFIATIIFGYRRLLYILKFVQQQDYYNYRTWRFAYRQRNMIDKRVTIPTLGTAIVFIYYPEPIVIIAAIMAIILQIIREKNPTKGAILPLVKTARVKRLFWTAFILWIITVSSIVHIDMRLAMFIVPALAFFAPVFIMVGNKLMQPVEWRLNRKFIIDAKKILKKYSPIVIGITGSYAKTSMKNILHHILGSVSTSLTTKRSINTLMGLVRTVREELNQPYKFFIAEMGMGGPGQLIKIIKLMNPKYAMIMSVGTKYFENFGSQDKIAREFFLLSKYIATHGGETMLNTELIAPEFINKYAAQNDLIFESNQVMDIKQTIDGITFTIDYDDEQIELFAPVFGAHQAKNIAMAYIMARRLGVSSDSIVMALKTLPQTEHRLELKREGGLVILDDSYNSNKAGFISAMETGKEIKGTGRLIVITPGMVSLGALHARQHTDVGQVANKLADIVIAINADRILDFTNQIAPDKLITAASLKDAREWLAMHSKPGDIVLIENDLPDLYVEKISI